MRTATFTAIILVFWAFNLLGCSAHRKATVIQSSKPTKAATQASFLYDVQYTPFSWETLFPLTGNMLEKNACFKFNFSSLELDLLFSNLKEWIPAKKSNIVYYKNKKIFYDVRVKIIQHGTGQVIYFAKSTSPLIISEDEQHEAFLDSVIITKAINSIRKAIKTRPLCADPIIETP